MQLINRNCPVCKRHSKFSKLHLKLNVNKNQISSSTFSSRKIPEFMNFEMVKCNFCKLIYSSKIPNLKTITNLYSQSLFLSSLDSEMAARNYYHYIKKYLDFKKKNYALEIGAGNGIFLKFIKKLGFKNLLGIEPSVSAVKSAPKYRRKFIKRGFFDDIKLKKNSYDLVCCFMTMEHVYDPAKLISKVFKLLNKGGQLVLVTHDCDYFIHKLLKKKSPIIDIEHLQLFSTKTIRYFLKKRKFKEVRVVPISNTYSSYYWAQLLPLPLGLKLFMLKIIKFLRISTINLSLNVGNIMTVATK